MLHDSITPAFIRSGKIFMIITHHQIYFQDSKQMQALAPDTVDLVVTSPPYPMIKMWDTMFSDQNAAIGTALNEGDGSKAFEMMHRELDAVWQEVWRVLKPGACINVGDAARTIDGQFQLYANHSRILSQLIKTGFQALPAILWRKQTNAPNKFMGSGMLPSGAYVTLEHEYILILRKGPRREFKRTTEKQNRRQSAFFWEERNTWFSDIWMDIKGTAQNLGDRAARRRSAAFPFDVAYRLINMFSVKGDLVMDPFFGIGTTMWAAMTAGRSCVGYEIEEGLRNQIHAIADSLVRFANARIAKRIQAHEEFLKQNRSAKDRFKYTNRSYQFPVMTRQEMDIYLNPLTAIEKTGYDRFNVIYSSERSPSN
jgi:DNA modification methylase